MYITQGITALILVMGLITTVTAIIRAITIIITPGHRLHLDTGAGVDRMAAIIPIIIITKIIITAILSPSRARCQATVIMIAEIPPRREGTIIPTADGQVGAGITAAALKTSATGTPAMAILSTGQSSRLTAVTDISPMQDETITPTADGQVSTGIVATTLKAWEAGMGDRKRIQSQALSLRGGKPSSRQKRAGVHSATLNRQATGNQK